MLTLFSDSCFGQNNFLMVYFWNQQVLERFEQIDHKFLVRSVSHTSLTTTILHTLKSVKAALVYMFQVTGKQWFVMHELWLHLS